MLKEPVTPTLKITVRDKLESESEIVCFLFLPVRHVYKIPNRSSLRYKQVTLKIRKKWLLPWV